MKALLAPFQARPRLLIAAGVGTAVAISVAADVHLVTRLLFAWNAGVWVYLVLIFWMMARADHTHLRRVALAHSEGAAVVLGVVIAAAVVSVAAIIIELSGAKGGGTRYALTHVLLALVTVAGSWLLLPTLFALSYASLFYRSPQGAGKGLAFPAQGPADPPDYWDFMYFSFTIAVASQTADVSITSRPMRKLVLLQAVLSFVFNTAILALSINIAAGLL